MFDCLRLAVVGLLHAVLMYFCLSRCRYCDSFCVFVVCACFAVVAL